jgi:PSP1 C-terminal conserved region
MEIIVESPEPRDGRGPAAASGEVLRIATAEDETAQRRLRNRADAEFSGWARRIAEWEIDLQLIDLEWTLDDAKLVLYVLNERGPECTKLALQAAAAGLGVIEVQPVSAEGLKPQESGGGCGSCGCGH